MIKSEGEGETEERESMHCVEGSGEKKKTMER